MTREYSGKDLARVLLYFDLVGGVDRTDFNICCPFHDDPNPSMRITLDNGKWYCFGCGLHGDVFDFIKNAFPELDDLEALLVLEKILHSKEVIKMNVQYKKKKRENSSVYLNEAKDYYYGLKQNDWFQTTCREEDEVLAYLKSRRLTEKILTCCKCKVNKYNRAYPIIFPILENGFFLGWVSRAINKKVESYRKYLYNEGFKKRLVLCGEYQPGCVPFLCEGYFDYLSLRFRGNAKNTVAIMGWHISDEQVKKLKQNGISTVVCALDNKEEDKAGAKGYELLKKYFDVIPFCYPRGVKDPGEMGDEELLQCVAKAKRRSQM